MTEKAEEVDCSGVDNRSCLNDHSKRVLVYGSALMKTMLLLNLSQEIKFFSSTWLQDQNFHPRETAKQYNQPLSADFETMPVNINREFLMYKGVDFVVGSWHSAGFGDYVWMIPEYLQSLNIGSYVSGQNSCDAYAHRFWCDVWHLGSIFGVTQKAGEIIDQYVTIEQELRDSLDKDDVKPSVIIFRGKFKKDSSYIAGVNNFLVDLLRKFGWQIVHPGDKFGRDWVVVKDEFILAAQPHLIVIVGENPKDMVQILNESYILRLLSAVRKNHVVWLSYDEASSSPDYIEGLRKIYDAVRNMNRKRSKNDE